MQKVNDNIGLLLALGTVGMLLLAVSVVVLHIRSQNRILRQKQLAQQAEIEHQKQLLHAIITSQEAERKRIGQDLHDDIGAALSGLRLSLEMFEPAEADRTRYKISYKTWKESIDEIIAELRHIAHHLSPSLLSLHGLIAALNKQLDFINRTSFLQAVIENNANDEISQLDLKAATAIYRVMEELLNNTMKHAKATTLNISFNMIDNNLVINYSDNGIGLPAGISTAAVKGMGLQNIESRLSMINATYQIADNVSSGFQIQIVYPYQTAITTNA